MFELQKLRISEIRIIEIFYLEIFKGPESFVWITESSNYRDSNYGSFVWKFSRDLKVLFELGNVRIVRDRIKQSWLYLKHGKARRATNEVRKRNSPPLQYHFSGLYLLTRCPPTLFRVKRY